jgi:CBS-domain-containing membrane protein
LEQTLEHELELFEAIISRARLTWLLRHFPPRPVWAGFVCFNCFVAIALLSVLAMASRTPFIFPSLGPTAYLLFFTPRAAAASPKHAICGHAVGLLFGWLALWITGLSHAAPVTTEGVNFARVLAGAMSLGGTGAAMVMFNVGHPPAGATTLIVSLGFTTGLRNLLVIEGAVLVLVAYTIIVNRLAGIEYPIWSRRQPAESLPRPPLD